jgi:hypothetical protein
MMLLLQHLVLVLVFNLCTVVLSPGGWVRKHLCEQLSGLLQAAFHLPPTASQLLLQALFIELC